MSRVSVIVPVYNTASYLQECINSILAQRFTDFELLLVDDGSTDGSALLCDSIAVLDKRIRVFHKNNGGVSSARNLGLREARGEYVTFIDSDDYVSETYLEHLLCVDSDLTVAGVCKFGAVEERSAPREMCVFSLSELPSHWISSTRINYLYHFPVCKLYRLKVIRNHQLQFDERLLFSEDLCFNLAYYSLIDTICEVPYADYKYRVSQADRDRKYQLSARQLSDHVSYHNEAFAKLQSRIRTPGLETIHNDVNLRLFRKFISFLMSSSRYRDFSNEVKQFKAEDWSSSFLALLHGKRYPRIMAGAMNHPFLTYLIEIRIRSLLNR